MRPAQRNNQQKPSASGTEPAVTSGANLNKSKLIPVSNQLPALGKFVYMVALLPGYVSPVTSELRKAMGVAMAGAIEVGESGEVSNRNLAIWK